MNAAASGYGDFDLWQANNELPVAFVSSRLHKIDRVHPVRIGPLLASGDARHPSRTIY